MKAERSRFSKSLSSFHDFLTKGIITIRSITRAFFNPITPLSHSAEDSAMICWFLCTARSLSESENCIFGVYVRRVAAAAFHYLGGFVCDLFGAFCYF